MSFDAWVVGFGLSRVLVELKLATSPGAYNVLLAVIVIDSYLLYRFFRARQGLPHRREKPAVSFFKTGE
jgi:hypothetical protein